MFATTSRRTSPPPVRIGSWVLAISTNYAGYLVLVLTALLLSLPSLGSSRIDDLDSAHHLTSGLFIRDFLLALPAALRDPIRYTLAYYAQYPALGFLFWPPLVPGVEGLFFLLGTPGVPLARICILGFGVALVLLLYRALRDDLPNPLRVLTILTVVLTPAIATYFQQVMIEVPALAMTMLVVVLYRRVVATEEPRWTRLGLLALAGAAALYTKQTTAFIFPALLLDVVVNHRRLLANRRVWVALVLVILLVAPLAWFTLKFGTANLQQSVGSDKSFVMNSKAPPERWSLTGWTFYAIRLPRIMHIVPVVLLVASLVYAAFQRAFFTRHALWLGWAASWYLLFSYFLNKQDRYMVLLIPACIVLGGLLLSALQTRLRWPQWMACGILAVPCLAGVAAIPRIVVDGFDGVAPMVKALIAQHADGNILYIGDRHQMIVPFVRTEDQTRTIHTLRGGDILSDAPDLGTACKEFRVRWIVIEQPSPATQKMMEPLLASGLASAWRSFEVQTAGKPVPFSVLQYQGLWAAEQKPVPLGLGNVGRGAVRSLGR